jgi:hypothetical protein
MRDLTPEGPRGNSPREDASLSVPPLSESLYLETVVDTMRTNLDRVWANFQAMEHELADPIHGSKYSGRQRAHLEKVLQLAAPDSPVPIEDQIQQIARTFNGLVRFCKFKLQREDLLKELFDGYVEGPRNESGCYIADPHVERFCREGEGIILRTLGVNRGQPFSESDPFWTDDAS